MRRKTPEPNHIPAKPGKAVAVIRPQGGGRQFHKPTRYTRRIVESWARVGRPQDEIAAKLRIDMKTLREHYRLELDTALPEANAEVGGKLYDNCMKGDQRSIEWWEKTRARMVPAVAVYATVDDRTMSSSDAKARFLQGVMNLIAADQIENEQRPPDGTDPGVPKVIDVTPEPEQDDGDGVME